MLGACQRRPPTVAGKPDEILRYQRYRAPRAPLPRRVSRRIDDNLTHDSPTGMVRIATGDEKPGQRLRHPQSSGLGPVSVQVPQCGANIPAALHCPGELPRSPPRLASFIIDPFTVLGRRPALMLDSYDQHQSPSRSVQGRTSCGRRGHRNEETERRPRPRRRSDGFARPSLAVAPGRAAGHLARDKSVPVASHCTVVVI
jgi:hypothetical protein